MKFFDGMKDDYKTGCIALITGGISLFALFICITTYNITELVLDHQCSTIEVEK